MEYTLVCFFLPTDTCIVVVAIPSLSSQICQNQNPAAKTKLESAQKYLTPNLLNLSYIDLPRFLQHCCNTAAVLTIYIADSDIAV